MTNHNAGGTGGAGGAIVPPIFGRSRSKSCPINRSSVISKSFSKKRSSVITGTPKYTDLPPELNQENTDESTSFRKGSLFLKSLKRKVHPQACPNESLFSFRVPNLPRGEHPKRTIFL